MALRLLESFDTYAAKADLGIKWGNVGFYSDLLATGGRYGGGCMYTGTVYSVTHFWSPSDNVPLTDKVIAGQALLTPVDWGSGGHAFDLRAPLATGQYAGTDVQVFVVEIDGLTKQLSVSAVIGGTLTFVEKTARGFQPGRWNYLEFKCDLSGNYELRVNEETWASGTADLSGSNLSDHFTIVGVGLASAMSRHDDIYVCDGSGSTHNDFLGDIAVKVIYPVADTAQKDFARSEGSYNYATVDDPKLSTADYNYASQVGDKDLFEMGNLNITGEVRGVQVVAVASKSGAKARAIKSVLKPNVTEYKGPTHYLTQDTPNGSLAVFEINPETGAPWTPDDINALVCGYEVSV